MSSPLCQCAQLSWNADLQVTSADGACELALGHPAQKLIGKPLHETLGVPKDSARELDAAARSAATRVFLRAELSKEPRWLHLSIGVVDGLASAGVLNFSAILSGAPPLQISRLSSSLSHELRNPLSSVKMAVQTLQRNTHLSDRDQRRLVIANREIRTVERMLWLLSEYGRDTEPTLETVYLRALLQESCALIAPELAEHEIDVTVEGEHADECRTRVDTGRLRPVLAQLLLNVAMGQPDGSQVLVRLSLRGHGATMELQDPSATFPVDEKETLFLPFGSMLARGAGLSLATLHWVMRSLGGDVTAGAATPGTVYTLSFPG